MSVNKVIVTATSKENRYQSDTKKMRVSVNTPRAIATTSFIFLRIPTVNPIGALAMIMPIRNIYRNAGGTAIVPMFAPAKNPMPEPMAVDTSPIQGPIKILATNMAIGAKVIVDSGGGIGTAIIVVTAIKADITPIRANLVAERLKTALSLVFFPSASIIWFRF